MFARLQALEEDGPLELALFKTRQHSLGGNANLLEVIELSNEQIRHLMVDAGVKVTMVDAEGVPI